MLQSCWQISSKVILLPIHYVICIFINKQVDIYSLAKLQFFKKKAVIFLEKLLIFLKNVLVFDMEFHSGLKHFTYIRVSLYVCIAPCECMCKSVFSDKGKA